MSIFKYMSENRIENILIDNKIRFTQPIYFNDPFEVKLAMKGFDTDEKLIKNFDMNFMKIIQEEYEKLDFEIKYKISFETFLFFANSRKEERKKLYLNVMGNETTFLMIKKEFDEIINKLIGILSLTTKFDNLLMWAHYSNEHKGFVVEFDSENDFFKMKDDNYIYKGIQKVNYSKIRPHKFLIENEWEEIFLTKSEEWSYENEYRIIQRLQDADEVKGNFSLFKFPKEMIQAIYCGCNMDTLKKERIIEIIKNDNELNHIKVFEMKLSDKYYELECIQVL